MSILLPFEALCSTLQPPPVFIPGEEPQPLNLPVHPAEGPALFLYRQEFRFPGDNHHSTRSGITGVLDRAEARVLAHEEVLPGRVEACRGQALETSGLFLWCRDDAGDLFPLLEPDGAALIDVSDRSGCRHLVWPLRNPGRIAAIQACLGRRELFIADGHHRNAAGWNLATIQVRTPSLRTLAAHRLVFEEIELPAAVPIDDLEAWWAGTPRGSVRFGVETRAGLHGIELAHLKSERNVAVLNRVLLGGRVIQPIRTIAAAKEAVHSGQAAMAFLLEPLSVDRIEADARRGALLPPKSTDFYPKLAGGLIMRAHQNETAIPPVAQRPGVRNPSS